MILWKSSNQRKVHKGNDLWDVPSVLEGGDGVGEIDGVGATSSRDEERAGREASGELEVGDAGGRGIDGDISPIRANGNGLDSQSLAT